MSPQLSCGVIYGCDTKDITGRLLTHWGRVTHICVSEITIIGSDNGLSPGRRQAIIWTDTGILLMGPLRTNFSEIFIEIHTFWLKQMRLKMSSGKWRPYCLGLNELRRDISITKNEWPVFSYPPLQDGDDTAENEFRSILSKNNLLSIYGVPIVSRYWYR